MALKAILKWKNDDSTRDINTRFAELFEKGVLSGGILTPVPLTLQVYVTPFALMSNDGMLVTNDTSETITIPLDQTSIVSLKAKHNLGGAPTLTYHVTEVSAFNLLLDIDDHIVFGEVTVNTPATQVTSGDISYNYRKEQDKRGRSSFRGHLVNSGLLPADPNFNRPGDFYVINAGIGDLPELHAWDGLAWQNITQTLSLASDLTQHRNNLFTNEKHLTDAQEDAALGSFGSPSAGNPYVTSTDPRIPTQTENDALVGSDGTSSSTNKFITEEFPLAYPTSIFFALGPGGAIPIPLANGPVFVGNGAVGSANKYFLIMHPTEAKGYYDDTAELTSTVIGVFKDALLTIPVNPSVDADSKGYYSATDIYLQVDNSVSLACRLLYGKKQFLGAAVKDFTLITNPGDGFIPAQVIETVSNAKGYPFGTLLSDPEQNKNLRTDLDGLASYIGSVLDTNIVAADEDFSRLSLDPILGATFEKNEGISPIYTFTNTGLVTFSYLAGTVTYTSPVALASVAPGDIFIDGAGNEYIITAVNDGADTLAIISKETGLAPLSVITSVGSSVDGSCKVNNNPRDLLLNEMKLSHQNEIIHINEIQERKNEFSKPDGFLSFGIKRKDGRFDPRIAFYGGFENKKDEFGNSFVTNSGSTKYGSIFITGFFTDVAIMLRTYPSGPSFDVYLDGRFDSSIDTTGSAAASSAISLTDGKKYFRIPFGLGASSSVPHTVEIRLLSFASDPLDISGIELLRESSHSLALLEPGISFESARIVKRDSITTTVPIFPLTSDERGGRTVYAADDNSYVTVNQDLLDLDLSGTPSGTIPPASTVITVTSGVGKLNRYKVGDILELDDGGVPPGFFEIKRISAIASPLITIDSPTAITSGVCRIKHICSTTSLAEPGEETESIRLKIPEDFINSTSFDLSGDFESDRFAISKDGHTLISGTDLSVQTSGIHGSRALRLGSSGTLTIRALTTRLDIISVAATSATFDFSIDGSPAYTITVGPGVRRHTLFSNARYQDHEIVITNTTSGNLTFSQMVLFGPFKPKFSGIPNELADLSKVASYRASKLNLVASPLQHPWGGVFFNDYQYIQKFDSAGIDPWSFTLDFSKANYGAYTSTANAGAFADFYFLGTGFELQYLTGPDHGYFSVFVDGTPINMVGGSLIGTFVSGNTVDGYSVSYSRRNVGVSGIAYGYHRVTMINDNPSKNPSSSDYKMAFNGYFNVNSDNYLTYGINKEGIFSGITDSRVFNPLIDDNTVNIFDKEVLAGKVNVTVGSLTHTVTLPTTMPDINYSVVAHLSNLIDGSPTYQPTLVTAITTTSFTVAWNAAIPSSNYFLHYIIVKP